jgi:hypothetical protein
MAAITLSSRVPEETSTSCALTRVIENAANAIENAETISVLYRARV